MKRNIIKLIFSIFLLTQLISAQESDLYLFNNLTGKEWKAEGAWGDGTIFKQETIFMFDLNNTLVITKSKGFTDKEQTK